MIAKQSLIDNIRRKSPEVYKSKAVGLVWRFFKLVFILGVAYVILYPVIIKLFNALKSKEDMYDLSIFLIPKHPTLYYFKTALEFMPYGKLLANTVFLSVVAAFLQLTACTLSAYALARFNFKLRKVMFFGVILMLVLPPQAYMLTTYSQFRYFDGFGLLKLFGIQGSVNLLNTTIPYFILSAGCCGFKNGVFIYVLRNFFETLPKELEEAAYIDGAGMFRIFYSVMLPNAKPALITVSMLAFVWTWNDTFYASLLAPNMKLMSQSLAQLALGFHRSLNIFGYATENLNDGNRLEISGATNAGSFLIILPLIIVFFAAQKYFTENSERTGLTGM